MKNLISPATFVLSINLLVFILWLIIPVEAYNHMAMGIEKNLSIMATGFFLSILMLFIISIQVGEHFIKGKHYREQFLPSKTIKKIIIISLLISIFGLIKYFYDLSQHLDGNLIIEIINLNVILIKKTAVENGLRTPYVFNLNYIAIILVLINKFIYKRKNALILYILACITPLARAIFMGERNSIIYIFLIIILFSLNDKNTRRSFLKLITYGILSVSFFIFVESFRSFVIFKDSGIAENSLLWGFSTLINYLVLPINYLQYTVENINVVTFPALSLDLIYGQLDFLDIIVSQKTLFLEVRNAILNSTSGSEAFNNLSFFSEIYIEFNLFSYLYIIFLGIFVGTFFTLFKKQQLIAMLVYPMIFVGLFESYRLNFFNNSTFITVNLFILIIFFGYLKKHITYYEKEMQ